MAASGSRIQSASGGYTLVEIATVLTILGALALTVSPALESMQQARLHNGAQAHAETARQALRAYLLRNKRLPCPDSSAFGDRGRSTEPCDAMAGWLPYETLGLETPERNRRIRYGVHRATVDLVAPSAFSVDDADLEGRSAMAVLLTALAGQAPTSAAPYYAPGQYKRGDACAGPDISNPAFVLVAPGANLDGDSGPAPGFDGPNRGFATGTDLCVAPASRPTDHQYDDVVVTESAASLLGWLTTSTR